MSLNNKTALITGASSGIGAAFANVFAQNNFNLILVARRTEHLIKIKNDLAAHQVKIICITKDLAHVDAAQELYDEIHQTKLTVDVLINNAGFGGQGIFHERNWLDEAQMMDLNMRTLSHLCHLFLPEMVARNQGKILNVASSAGLLPGGPLQSTYFATKAFVVSLSNGISAELEGTNVTVTALCPGATKTEFEKTAGLEGTKLFSGKLYSAKEVAQDGYNALMKGKRIKKTGLSFINRINLALAPFVPDSLILSMIKKMQVKK